MPQINLTGAGGSPDEPTGGSPAGVTPSAVPAVPSASVLQALKDVSATLREVRRGLGITGPASAAGRAKDELSGLLGPKPPAGAKSRGAGDPWDALRASIRSYNANARLSGASPSASRALRAALEPAGEIAQSRRLRERSEALEARAVTRERRQAGEPPEALRAALQGAPGLLQSRRLRERSEAQEQRQAAREAKAAGEPPEGLRAALQGASEIMRARRLRERSDALEATGNRETLRGALRGAGDLRTVWRLKERTLAGEAREERDEMKAAGAGFRAFRQVDTLKRRTLAGEARERNREAQAARSEAEYENRERDGAAARRDRAYREDRAAAEYENSNRSYIARRQDRARAAQEREAERARKAAERADTDMKLGRIRRAGSIGRVNLMRMVRDDRSNLGTIAAAAPAFQAARVVGGVLGTAIEAAEAVIESPRVVSSLMNKFVSGAQPYRDLVLGSSALGRAGGYDGQRLAGMWTPTPGWDGDWRRLRGLATEDLPSISAAYGAPARNQDSQDGIVAAAADADLAPRLGGLGKTTYAEMLGTAQLLGVKGDGQFGQSGDPGRTDYRHGGAAYGYLRDWQRTMTAAVAAGMDRSVVRSSIEGLMRQSAASGAAEINAPKTADAWFRMASSGSPDARTGDEQAGALAGMTDQVNSGGLSGGVVPNAVFHAYLARRGGLPRDAAGVAKLLGVDPSSMDPGERRKFDDVVEAAQSGNEAVTFEYAKPFLYANQGASWKSIVDQSGIAPRGVMHDLIASRLRGEPTGAYQDEQAGQARPGGRGSLGVGDVPDDVRRAIYDASDDTKVDSSILFGLTDYETGGKFDNRLKSGTGAVGLGQITQTAITDLTGGDKVEAEELWRDSQTDQKLNAHLTARYYALLKKRYGSDHEALRHYHGLQVDKNGVGPDEYAASVEAREASYQNDPHRLREVTTDQSDLNQGAAKQDESFAEGLGKLTDVVVSWNEKVNQGTDAVVKWTAALIKSTAAMAGVTTSSQSHDLPAHYMAHKAHRLQGAIIDQQNTSFLMP